MAMGSAESPHIPYFLDVPHLNGHHQVPVKTEASSSPDLSPGPPSLQHFQFKFNPSSIISHGAVQQARNLSESPSCAGPQPIYHFGPSRFHFNTSSEQHWPRSIANHLPSRHDIGLSQRHINRPYHNQTDHIVRPAMSYSDDYDNASDLADIVGDGEAGGSYGDSGNANEKGVRRRSSKGKPRYDVN